MSRIIVSESITLDGVFEAPAKVADESFVDAGWTAPYNNDEIMQYVFKNTSGGGALLLGRVTYEHFAASWSPQTGPVADYMNNAKKYVVSNTLKTADWNNSTLIKGNIVDEIKKLKQSSDTDMAILGSSVLAQALMQQDLIDNYMLLIYPVVLGQGKRFFKDGAKSSLKLTDSKAFKSGVVFASYTPDRK